ncbi:polymerase [Flavobacterium faecale]|uniref:Polymerase n=1 Tax=Flavobacterium faecale TaxID=1355330 RepID=A0A2S1LFF9_9FLAO|nr:DUF4240 domain-containing protein [Flavobacterium faecale]AWG22467.1 polymerase [Flavobacterium faecale]
MKTSATILFLSLFNFLAVFAQNNVKDKEVVKTVVVVKETEPLQVFDSIAFVKSAEMLPEDQYWAIIEKSKEANVTQAYQEIFITNELEKLTPKEIIGFRLRTDKLLFDTYKSNLWCAAYIMNGGTDGGFDYFRCWIIAQGKDAFNKAVANPDSLADLVQEGKESYEFEGFWFVAMNAFMNKTDHEIYDYIDYDTFVTNDEHYPLITFNWSVDEPKSMEKICPTLFKKLWK